jgi:hypothetical protein
MTLRKEVEGKRQGAIPPILAAVMLMPAQAAFRRVRKAINDR